MGRIDFYVGSIYFEVGVSSETDFFEVLSANLEQRVEWNTKWVDGMVD
jgi:hypothetical protein